jgi:SIR2-like domain
VSLRDFDAFSPRALADDRDISLEYLSRLLQRQELALLLGAGVSITAGFPGWEDLVDGCQRDVGLDASVSAGSARDLMASIDRVRRQLEKLGDDRTIQDVVRSNLYQNNWLTIGEYPLEILENPTLIAIGALVMSSSRGSVGEVFTMNFDDLLEWYLHLHGFRTQVVSDFPTRLSGDADVTVFHPHGFLPLIEEAYKRSEWLVLSETELIARLAAGPDQPWPTLLGSRFLSKRFLAVGTSMNDLDVDVHLHRANGLLAQTANRGPIGFAVDVNVPPDRVDSLLERGIVPVSLGNYAEIPEFLLAICQKAALSNIN